MKITKLFVIVAIMAISFQTSARHSNKNTIKEYYKKIFSFAKLSGMEDLEIRSNARHYERIERKTLKKNSKFKYPVTAPQRKMKQEIKEAITYLKCVASGGN